jgi:hypothetical protein
MIDSERCLEKSRLPIADSTRLGVSVFAKKLEKDEELLQEVFDSPELLKSHGFKRIDQVSYHENGNEDNESLVENGFPSMIGKRDRRMDSLTINQKKIRLLYDDENYDDTAFYSLLLKVIYCQCSLFSDVVDEILLLIDFYSKQ